MARTITADVEEIKHQRTIRNWSQNDLARESGLSLGTIEDIEAGHPTFRKTLNKIAKKFGLPSYQSLLPKTADTPTIPPPIDMATILILIVRFSGLISDYIAKGYPKQFIVDMEKMRIIVDGVRDLPEMRDGSVIIELALTKADASRVFEAYVNGDLVAFNVESVTILRKAAIDDIDFDEYQTELMPIAFPENLNPVTVFQIRVFYDVIRHKSYSLAAKEYNYAQSHVMKLVKNLRDRLGGELVMREDGWIVPTPFGAIVFDKCREILKQLSGLGQSPPLETTQHKKKKSTSAK